MYISQFLVRSVVVTRTSSRSVLLDDLDVFFFRDTRHHIVTTAGKPAN